MGGAHAGAAPLIAWRCNFFLLQSAHLLSADPSQVHLRCNRPVAVAVNFTGGELFLRIWVFSVMQLQVQ